jgi:hypothetical protein
MHRRCAVSERDETDTLSHDTICVILRCLSLFDAAVAARVCRKWHAASRLCESETTQHTCLLKTRWSRVGNEDVRASIELRFCRVDGQLHLQASADVTTVRAARNCASDFQLTPLCAMNTMPWAGHRVGPWRRCGASSAWPIGADESLPGRPCQSRPVQPANTFTGSLPLTNDGCASATASSMLLCQGFVAGTLTSADGQVAELQLLPAHARLTLPRAQRRKSAVALDCFAGDGCPDFATLTRLLEEMAVQRPLRSHLQLRGTWDWTTDVRPSVLLGLPELDAARRFAALDRANLVECALRDAGCVWNSVETLREVDFFCKEALRHRHMASPDIVAEQLGFTAHRHAFRLDVKAITARVLAAEVRFKEALCVMGAVREQVGACANADSVARVLAERDDDAAVQEIVLSLAWAERCGAKCPWRAPPRPEVTGVLAPVAEGVFSASQLEHYTKSVLGEKSLCACSLRGFARPSLY